MPKRKKVVAASSGDARTADENLGSSSDDDSASLLDVEFEWFDPQEIDFHGLKLLLRQLLDADADLFDLSALTSLILSQPLLGSTVKVPEDGVATNMTDPFAFLTVLNLHTHRDRPEIAALTAYLATKSATVPTLAPLAALLEPGAGARVGLVLAERFINMPPQVVPPMYRMLLEEIAWAVEAKEPYMFSHYLVLSKTYTEVASVLDHDVEADDRIDDNGESVAMQPPRRKRRKGEVENQADIFYFHAEDEKMAEFAIGRGGFDYTKKAEAGASDARRAFQEAGVRPRGHMILLDGSQFAAAVEAVEEYIGSQA